METIATMGQLFAAAIDAIPESHKTNPRKTVAGVPVEIFDVDHGVYRTVSFRTVGDKVQMVIGDIGQLNEKAIDPLAAL